MIIKKNDIILQTECMCEQNGRIYFAEYETGDIFEFNVEKKTTTIIWENPIKKYRTFGDIIIINNRIYLIPFWGEKIYVLEKKEDGKIESTAIKSLINQMHSLSASVYNNCIYATDCWKNGVWKWNLINNEITFWNNKYEYKKIESENSFARKTLLVADKLYIPSCMSNIISIFDLNDNTFENVHVGGEENRFSAICKSSEGFLIAPRRGNKFIECDSFFSMKDYFENEILTSEGCANIVNVEDKIAVIPMEQKEHLMFLDFKTKKIYESEKLLENECICNANNCTYLYSNSNGILQEIEKEGQINYIGMFKMKINNENTKIIKEYINKKFLKTTDDKEQSTIIYEQQEENLSSFCNIIMKYM